ncbi:MucB/RseB C-terminal domain-containing protein [Halomonas sp. DP4Y7-1]|uniref:MucB/RseB C-terminal domain-containing protein n=1 Tax=Halomonas sp. DP4Y7-1 TaxID=2859084 RepID=UPI001C943629|nr:MucB/RseB C-terminal domain-containing protein [Halomonas sp. DP4Y7-1]MBY6232647.1 MucB/RseB C-terminal domain-containing protein [Halomonas sp. DP4Y7-1]
MPYAGPHASVTGRLTLLLACLCLSPLTLAQSAPVSSSPALAGAPSEAADVQSVYDCAALPALAPPSEPGEWFERSVWASHCYQYQARAVRIVDDEVVTLSVARDIRQGVERDRLHFLDGPNRSLLREGGAFRFELPSPEGAAPASPEALVKHLSHFYRLRLDGEERIANRAAVRLELLPLDDMRYGYRMWLDRETAIPLKRALIDDNGRVLDTFQVVAMTPPQRYQGRVELKRPASSATLAWRAGWLPGGFVAQPLMAMADDTDEPRRHKLYSDGLSTISLFVEPVAGARALRPGVHRLGASHAAVRRIQQQGQLLQVVAVGELPPSVLIRVVETLEMGEASSAPSLTTDGQSTSS